jgi:hypothetical protein
LPERLSSTLFGTPNYDLPHELRKGTIDRIMAMSDLELGLQVLRGISPQRRP